MKFAICKSPQLFIVVLQFNSLIRSLWGAQPVNYSDLLSHQQHSEASSWKITTKCLNHLQTWWNVWLQICSGSHKYERLGMEKFIQSRKETVDKKMKSEHQRLFLRVSVTQFTLFRSTLRRMKWKCTARKNDRTSERLQVQYTLPWPPSPGFCQLHSCWMLEDWNAHFRNPFENTTSAQKQIFS